MDVRNRSDTTVLDEYARVFEELAHIVRGRFTVGRNGVLRTEAKQRSHESIWRHVDRGEVLPDLVDLSALRIITVYSDSVDAVVDELSRKLPEAQVKANAAACAEREMRLRQM